MSVSTDDTLFVAEEEGVGIYLVDFGGHQNLECVYQENILDRVESIK